MGSGAAFVKTGMWTCLVALVAAFHLGLAGAASVRPLPLDELIDSSAVIIEGTCIDNRVELDAGTGFVVTHTTFEVRDTLKGRAAARHVIKQIGGTLPDGSASYNVSGVPTFSVGNDYVVFLAGVSQLGFSSPLGLAQGRFNVLRSPDGSKVSNGRDFRAMTAATEGLVLPGTVARALAESAAPIREMALDDFKHIVTTRVGRPQ
jgi:hypothetical protein